MIYQLEDDGHPLVRMRTSVWEITVGPSQSFRYRVDAFSRVTGERLGQANQDAPPGSAAEFAASSRQFQSTPFRRALTTLTDELAERFRDAVPEVPAQH